ncbi:MAG: AEC family transporter [Clostridiales bacterium]|nr:AEC family transporter [Clostridiales bacterium]
MNVLIEVFVKILVAVALGFFLRKNRVLDERMQKGLSDMLLKAILPFSIVASANYERSSDLAKGMMAMLVASMLYYAVTLVCMRLLSKRLSMKDKEQRMFVTLTVFANTGFVGFPIMSALYGNKGLLLAVVFNMAYNVFMYTYGVHLVSGKTGNWKSVLLNPVTIASLLAILLFVSPVVLSEYVIGPIRLIGDMTVPLSMILIGSNLAMLPFGRVLGDPKSYIVSAMRLLVIPAVALAAMWGVSQLVTIDPTTAAVFVLMCALPCGSMNVIFSEKYNCAPDFAARATVQSMLLSMISLPTMAYICLRLFV